MLDDDFQDFKRLVGLGKEAMIGRFLAPEIRQLAWEVFGGPEISRQESLSSFFTAVMRRSGESTNGSADDYFDSLVKKWHVGGNKSLVLATYFYLHTVRSGKDVAERLDRLLFAGSTLAEHTGKPVPAAYVRPDDINQIPLTQQIHEAVMWLKERQEQDDTSHDVLISIARGYDPAYQGRDVAAIGEFLKERVEQWHKLRAQSARVCFANEQDRSLLEKASEATRQGNFDDAAAFLIEAERRFENEIEAPTRAKCERMALRAENIALTGGFAEASRIYDDASSTIAKYDERLSIRYARQAANALHVRAFNVPDVDALEVASRHLAIFWRSHALMPDGEWDTYGPLISYFNVMSQISKRTLDSVGLRGLEQLCREITETTEYRFSDQIRACLKGSLAHILDNNLRSAADLPRMKEATRLAHEGMKALGPDAPYGLWYTARSTLGSVLLSRAYIMKSAALARRSKQVYGAILPDMPRDHYPLEWARIVHNIGACSTIIGKETGSRAQLDQAILSYEEALQERSEFKAPLMFARTSASLGDCYFSIYELDLEVDALDRAIKCFQACLSVWKPASDGKNWFWYSACLAIALIVSAMQSGRFNELTDALKLTLSMDLAWEEYGVGIVAWPEHFGDVLQLARSCRAGRTNEQDWFEKARKVYLYSLSLHSSNGYTS